MTMLSMKERKITYILWLQRHMGQGIQILPDTGGYSVGYTISVPGGTEHLECMHQKRQRVVHQICSKGDVIRFMH